MRFHPAPGPLLEERNVMRAAQRVQMGQSAASGSLAAARTLMACANNPLVGDPLSFDQYIAMGHLSMRFGDERNITFKEWLLPRYGKQRRVALSVDNFSTLPLLVMGTERIATLHRSMAEHFACYLPLLDAPFEMPPLAEVMCWPRHLDRDPAHEWFRQVLLDCAA